MQNNPSEHTLTISGRSSATVTGVEDVDCFNEQIVVLRTSLGTLTLAGEGLNIPQLSLDQGTLVVEGEILSAEYDGRPKRSKSGFWGRLLR